MEVSKGDIAAAEIAQAELAETGGGNDENI
jgi:hypothetical protein